MMPLHDLHCDLLSYLAGDASRTWNDPQSRCSVPQLIAGGVGHQVLAIYSETRASSVRFGTAQLERYKSRPQLEQLSFSWAIENASSFSHESEPLKDALDRLDGWIKQCGRPDYVSLTWNQRNRFGGGTLEPSGLTEDGRQLIHSLRAHGIPVDLSHASDPLAEQILDLDCPVMASHSNFRAVWDHPRNLTDSIAREIFSRGGVVGLNIVCPILGDCIERLRDHAAHALHLGGEGKLRFGCDFFYEEVLPKERRGLVDRWFFEGYEDASCYPKLLELLSEVPTDFTCKRTHRGTADLSEC